MVQLFVCTSVNTLATAVAAIEAGVIPSSDGPRLLLAFNGAPIPEVIEPFQDRAASAPLLRHFDSVIDLNAEFAPHEPAHWNPRVLDAPVFERLLRRQWGIGDAEVELFVQSPQAPPTTGLASMFASGPIHVISDGLMTYAPIRNKLPGLVLARIRSVIYLDLLESTQPLLFSECPEVERRAVPIEAVRDAFVSVADAETDPAFVELVDDPRPTSLVLGQYLSALNIISASREISLQKDLIRLAAKSGAERVIFKPHPSAPPSAIQSIVSADYGLDVVVSDGPHVAETLMSRANCVQVVASFSTAMATARTLFGIDIASAGTEMLLKRLKPYENSNRVPLVIVDALTRSGIGDTPELSDLVRAVGYVQQPEIMDYLRDEATDYLDAMSPELRARYFPARRLAELDLPGGQFGKGERVAWALNQLDRTERGAEARRTLAAWRKRVAKARAALQG